MSTHVVEDSMKFTFHPVNIKPGYMNRKQASALAEIAQKAGQLRGNQQYNAEYHSYLKMKSHALRHRIIAELEGSYSQPY